MTALAWSWLYFFSILSAYYVIRPIRDEIGAAGGIENLPWLFTGTLCGMLIANPPFSALVTRLAPVRFISWTYRFFMANLVLFLVLLETTSGPANAWTGRIFYIWAAVFNLFVVSVFWGFLADVFNSEQSRRLFGFIAAGGTIGGIVGSSLTSALVEHLGPSRLLLVSAVLLEVAVFSVRRLARIARGLRERSGARGDGRRRRRRRAVRVRPRRPVAVSAEPDRVHAALHRSCRRFSTSSRPTSPSRASRTAPRERHSSPISTWRSTS